MVIAVSNFTALLALANTWLANQTFNGNVNVGGDMDVTGLLTAKSIDVGNIEQSKTGEVVHDLIGDSDGSNGGPFTLRLRASGAGRFSVLDVENNNELLGYNTTNYNGVMKGYESLGVFDTSNNELVYLSSSGLEILNSDAISEFKNEVSWTPDLFTTGSAASFTYNDRWGYAYKLNSLVVAPFFIDVASRSGGSGNARMQNLPYSVAHRGSILFSYHNSMVVTTATNQISGYVDTSDIAVLLEMNGEAIANLSDSSFNGSEVLGGVLVYITDD